MNKRFASWIATCGPIGHVKWAPGTLGSLFVIPIILFLSKNMVLFLIFLIFLTVLGIWSSTEATREFKSHDPSCVVIDEVCGMLLSFLFIPVRWETLVTGFILFRLFDITKPPPLRRLERFPEGLGIVLDDLGAGVYTNFLLQLLVHYAHL